MADKVATDPTRQSWLYHPKFPDQWRRSTLYSLATWVNGLAFRNIQFSETGMPVIKIAEIKGGLSGQTKFTQQTFDESVRVRPGDMLFSWSGQPETSIDVFWWNGPEGWLNQHVFRVTPKPCVHRTFFYYLLRYLKPHFVAIASNKQTTGLGHVTKRDLENMEVAYPDLQEQQAIACILGALDDKIELNRRMNQTLEATTRAIFKSWFVDFDPVRAKAAGQKPAGLEPEIAVLFPDAFEESELGPIPKGWKITSLADQITASKGLSYKGQYLCAEGEGLPMHNLNSVYEGGGYKHEGLKWYKGEYRPAHLLKPGDVIVTNTEQGFDYLLIGYSAIVPERYGPQGLFSHHLFRIRPKPTSYLPAWFTYLLLRTRRFHDLVAGHSNGTTVNMLPLDGLQKPKFVLPPEALVKRFETLFVPAQQRIEQIHDENASLAALRDTLLPKLISGELVVAEAERIAGRCV